MILASSKCAASNGISLLRHGRISRKEVEQISRIAMNELEVIKPGCSHTIVGGCVNL